MSREMRENPLNESFIDKMFTCKICGDSFIFTAGEQQFYRDRGLAEPRRCPDCRRSHRQATNEKRGVEK